MNCLYCRHVNSEDDARCNRCGRRLPTAPPRSAPENYVSSYVYGNTTALAVAPQETPAAMPVEPPATAAPQRTQIPRQTRLFTETVVPFPATERPQPHEPRPRARRHVPVPDGQGSLDFLPPAPHAPRTLKTSVE